MNVTRIWTGLLAAMLCCATTAAGTETKAEHYELRRDVYRLDLTGTPLARVLCTVRDSVTGATDTVVWSPEETRSNVRYALLPALGAFPLTPPQRQAIADVMAAKLVNQLAAADPQWAPLSVKERDRFENALAESLRDSLITVQKPGNYGAFSTLANERLLQQLQTEKAPLPLQNLSQLGKASLESSLAEVVFAITKKVDLVRPPEVFCRSERHVVQGGNQADSVVYYDAKPSAVSPISLQMRVIEQTSGPAAAVSVKLLKDGDLNLNVENVSGTDESRRVLQQRNDGIQTSRLRSLDPTTALVNDALTALATIALDRAKDEAKEYARTLVQEFLCDSLTVEKLRDLLEENPLLAALKDWPGERNLLHTTCTLVETLRVDELISAKDTLWKAIGVDAAALASALLKDALLHRGGGDVEDLMEGMSALVTSVLTTGSATTERDAQVLLLSLGRIGYDRTRAGSSTWRLALELGMAVLQDCLRANECSADELERLLREEIELAQEPRILAEWPELPAMLGRSANVFRPPPGTPPSTTAANAIALVLDTVEHALAWTGARVVCLSPPTEAFLKTKAGEKKAILVAPEGKCVDDKWRPYDASSVDKLDPDKVLSDELKKGMKPELYHTERETALRLVQAMRGIVAALQGRDVSTVIVAVEGVFEAAIVDECRLQGGKDCELPVTTAQLQRGFRVLTALAMYGSSYRKAEASDPSGEVEKLRAEERRNAVESLIDAVTDRSERNGDWVLSFGSSVTLGVDRRLVSGEDGSDYTNKMPLALPMGIALQCLPGCRQGPGWLGGYAMLTFLDLAQYATLAEEASTDETVTPEPEITTALRAGVEAGFLFGNPSFPVTVSGHVGYVPSVKIDDTSRSEWSVGASVGVYVPFIDFN